MFNQKISSKERKYLSKSSLHCLKSVRIWGCSGRHFSRIRTEYGVSIRIQSECGEMRNSNSEYGHFLRSAFSKLILFPIWLLDIYSSFFVLRRLFVGSPEHLFPSSTSLRIVNSTNSNFLEVLSSLPLLKIWLEIQPHRRKVGVHYVSVPWRYLLWRTSKNWCFFLLLSIIVNIIIAFCLYFYCFCIIYSNGISIVTWFPSKLTDEQVLLVLPNTISLSLSMCCYNLLNSFITEAVII